MHKLLTWRHWRLEAGQKENLKMVPAALPGRERLDISACCLCFQWAMGVMERVSIFIFQESIKELFVY